MIQGMDKVFKALADPTRRSLLDELHREDGQTLSALEARLPMTRIGVMKHLRVLEDAGLVTTRRRGREKLHFLNPVPIRLVHDRWVSKYAEPWAATLSDLKTRLETTMEKVFEIYIKTTPERLWQAITDPAMTQIYYFGSMVESDMRVGSPIQYKQADGSVDIDGEVLEADPPRKLVHSFTSRWEANDDPPSTVSWEITPMGSETCLLSVVDGGFASETATYNSVKTGWVIILSGLKTLVETGEKLRIETPEAAEATA